LLVYIPLNHIHVIQFGLGSRGGSVYRKCRYIAPISIYRYRYAIGTLDIDFSIYRYRISDK